MRFASCCLLVVSLLNVDGAFAEPPSSYQAAKRMLSEIHEDIGHLVTLYCGCPYERVGLSGKINSVPCGHETRTDETYSGTVQWEHVIPASWFGAHRPCWKKGHELCVRKRGKNKGKLYRGRDVRSEKWTPSFWRRSSIFTMSVPAELAQCLYVTRAWR